MKKLFLALLLVGNLGAVSLTGNLSTPLGLATGTLYLSPPLNVTLSTTCGGISGGGTISLADIPIAFVSGVAQTSPLIYGNDCFIPRTTAYAVRFVGTTGPTFFGTWTLTGTSVDVSTLILGVPGVIVGMPTGDQYISQPPNTKLYLGGISVLRRWDSCRWR